jgi:hypothetical protein
MGIQPRRTAQPDFPDEIFGHAISAFYGGRAEVHLRHIPAPVAVVDFTSMYPTLDTLMGIWDLVTAARINAIDVTDTDHSTRLAFRPGRRSAARVTTGRVATPDPHRPSARGFLPTRRRSTAGGPRQSAQTCL